MLLFWMMNKVSFYGKPRRRIAFSVLFLLGLFLFNSGAELHAQPLAWEWVRTANGPDYEAINSIAIDTIDHSLYFGGSYRTSLEIDGTTYAGTTYDQAYISRTDTTGNLFWTFQWLSSDSSRIIDVSSSPFGNVFFIGEFQDSLFFPNNLSATSYDTLISNGGQDLIVGYIQANGNRAWYRHYGGPGEETAGGVDRRNGNLYFTGTFEGTASFSSVSKTSAGGQDAFLVNASFLFGSTNWVRQAGGNIDARGLKVCSDGGGVYWAGTYGAGNMDIELFTAPTLNNIGGDDVFIAKYDHFGAPLWANRLGSVSNGNPDLLTGMGCDVTGVFVTGSYSSAFDIYRPGGAYFGGLTSAGSRSQFLLSYNPTSGEPQWSQRIAGLNSGMAGELSADQRGAIFVSGGWSGNSALGGGTSYPANGIDGYLARYANNGNFEWAVPIEGNGNQVPMSVAAEQELVVVAGFHTDTANFAGLVADFVGGSQDAFYARLGCPSPTSPNLLDFAGPDSTDCADSLNLYASGLGLSWQGTWTVLSGSATIAAPTDPGALVNFNGANGLYVLQWSMTTGGCSLADTVEIDILTPPVAATGPDTNICGADLTLYAQNTGPYTGTWSVLSGGGVVQVPTSNTSLISSLPPGQNDLLWTVGPAACQETDTLSIFSDSAITALAGPNVNLCGVQPINLAGNNPGILPAEWTLVNGGGTLADSSLFNTQFTPVAGLTELEWRVTNGVCEERDTVTVEVFSPLPAFAGNDTSICGDTLVLNASGAGTSGTGTWSILAGSGTFSNVNDSNATVSSLNTVIPANLLVWEVVNGACTTRDTLSITARQQPVTDAGPDTLICDTTYMLNGNFAANNGSLGWTVLSGGGILINPSLPFTDVEQLSPGANVFEYVWINGSCSDTDTVVVTRDAYPDPVNAGSDFTACFGDSALTGALTPVVGTGVWTSPNPAISFSPDTLPSTSVAGFPAGANTLIWTVTNGICPAESDTVRLDGIIAPLVDAGVDTSLCDTFATTLAGNVPPQGISGLWSVGNGPGGISFNTAIDFDAIVSGLGAGANELVWTLDDSGCLVSDTVVITVNVTPVVSAGPDQFLCDTFSTQLAGSNSGTNFSNWMVLTGGGTFSPTSNDSAATVSNLQPGTNALIWMVGPNMNCTAADTVLIDVSTPPTGTISAGADTTICEQPSFALTADSNFTGSGQWSAITPGISFTNINQPNTLVSGLANGGNLVVWTVTSGACSESDTLLVQVDSLTALVAAGADLDLCDADSFSFNAANPQPGTGAWTLLQGTGSAVDPTLETSLVLNVGLGTSLWIWEVTEGVCTEGDTVEIRNVPAPSPADAGADTILCGTDGLSLRGNVPAVGMGMWTGPGITQPANPNSPVVGLALGTNALAWTISNGVCPTESDTILVDVRTLDLADAGPDETICDTFITTLSAANNSGFWTDPSGLAQIADPNAPLTQVSDLILGTNAFVWTADTGFCQNSDTLQILVAIPSILPDAGPDQEIFETSAVLTGNDPGPNGNVEWNLVSGGGNIASAISPATTIDNLNPGLNVLTYGLSDGTCAAERDTLFIEVLALNVPTGFSPNGDQVNDTWVIRGVENFAPANVKVFNRWGNQVYAAENYQNDWDGATLTDDTYYYVLTLGDGRELNGYVILKR